MNPIIEVKNLSKEYIISHNVQPYYTLRDSLANLIKKPFSYFSSKNVAVKKEKFLALNDINFSVMPGEVVGIIGKNGAGKSTILKILSQITPPTSGSVHLRGRVASLLEVGTGFHPELTGRENIFLNGAILGMTQKEILQKFDEIVAFAEIEKFLDTPVKRYSSGMYVRLAFAVAAHLEPEILIIDEVLAVGDATFQKKCLGKMGEISKQEGRTVLFVSHNMAAVQNLCSKTMFIKNGSVDFFGNTAEAIKRYTDYGSQKSLLDFSTRKDRKGTQELIITSVEFRGGKNNESKEMISGSNTRIFLGFENKKNVNSVSVSISFNSIYGYRVLTLWSKFSGDILKDLPSKGYFECAIPKLSLRPGQYTIDVYVDKNGGLIDVIYNAAQVNVNIGDFYGTGYYPSEKQGDVMVEHSWKVSHKTI